VQTTSAPSTASSTEAQAAPWASSASASTFAGVGLQIRSSAAGSKQQGDRVDYQAVDAASEIYDRLPRQLGATVTEVAYVAGKGVQVTISSGETALLGDSSAIAYKLAVWAALRREAQVRGINYASVDLRYGNRPVLQ